VTLVRSLSVGYGDMFYIRHGSDNFTIIDCCLKPENRDDIIQEIRAASIDKGIHRFISTHPDEDHIHGIEYLDERIKIRNFYVVNNDARKAAVTPSFQHYCRLRDDPAIAFYVQKGSERRWMNKGDEERGSSGLSVLWPNPDNLSYRVALADAHEGLAFNNMSLVLRYRPHGLASFMWIGDLETEFMEEITDDILLSKTTVIFAPHHGRDTGKIPDSWLEVLDPQIIVIGQAPSRHLNYYTGYNTITQNRAGNISFVPDNDRIHIYASNSAYPMLDFCVDERRAEYDYYVGTLIVETEYTL